MARQEINLGAAPTGAGGDTTRSTGVKINNMMTDLYTRIGLLGSASNLNAGVSDGNVMLVGAGGWLARSADPVASINDYVTAFKSTNPNTAGYTDIGIDYGGMLTLCHDASAGRVCQLFFGQVPSGVLKFRSGVATSSPILTIYHTGNTTRGSGGVISAASPIMRIACVAASERRDLQEETFVPAGEWGVVNSEAAGVTVERMGVGEYRITGSLGLALEGWRTQDPCSPDGGRTLGVTQSEQSEDGSVIIRLFKQRWSLSDDGEMIPGLGAPLDVPLNSWIDVRLEMAKVEQLPPMPAA